MGDVSGKGNVGMASGATWISSGRYGKAIGLGAGAMVTVQDSATLDLTTSFPHRCSHCDEVSSPSIIITAFNI